MLRRGRDLSLVHAMPQDAMRAGVNMDFKSMLQGRGAVLGPERLKMRLVASGEQQGGDLLHDFMQALTVTGIRTSWSTNGRMSRLTCWKWSC